MTVISMAIAGFVVGFVLDALIGRLAREPYERGDLDGDQSASPKKPSALELRSETGAVVMPALLTTAAWYRTAAVVAATTAAFALLGRQYASDDAHLAITAFYASVLIICASTDILAYRVPNPVTYPAILAALGIGMIIPDANRLDVAVGGLIFGGILFVPSILTGGAMGMGDVKLALFVGLALGLTLIVPAMLIMALSGGLAALVLLLTRIRGKGDPIPYAPFIAGGALLTIVLQGTAFANV